MKNAHNNTREKRSLFDVTTTDLEEQTGNQSDDEQTESPPLSSPTMHNHPPTPPLADPKPAHSPFVGYSPFASSPIPRVVHATTALSPDRATSVSTTHQSPFPKSQDPTLLVDDKKPDVVVHSPFAGGWSGYSPFASSPRYDDPVVHATTSLSSTHQSPFSKSQDHTLLLDDRKPEVVVHSPFVGGWSGYSPFASSPRYDDPVVHATTALSPRPGASDASLSTTYQSPFSKYQSPFSSIKQSPFST
jgi:hypothetical protein